MKCVIKEKIIEINKAIEAIQAHLEVLNEEPDKNSSQIFALKYNIQRYKEHLNELEAMKTLGMKSC